MTTHKKTKKNLGNLLASVSAIAILVNASSVNAAIRTTTDSPAVIGVDNGLDAFVNDDTIQFGGNNVEVRSQGKGGAYIIGSIDLNKTSGSKFTIADGDSVTISNVLQNVVDKNYLSVLFSDSGQLTFNGSGDLQANFDSSIGTGSGLLLFSKDAQVLGRIGVINPLALVRIETVDVNVTLSGVAHSAKSFSLNNSKNGGFTVLDGGVLKGNVTGAGNLTFQESGAVEGSITITDGAVTAGGKVTLSANDHKATSFTLSNKGSEFFIKDGGNLQGDVKGSGTITFAGTSSVVGTIGEAAQALDLVRAGGKVTLDSKKHYATSFTLNDKGSEFFIKDGGSLQGDVKGSGTLTFAGDGELFGAIGEVSSALGKVVITKQVKLPGAISDTTTTPATIKPIVHYANEFYLASSSAKLIVDNKGILSGNVTTANNNQGVLRFTAEGKVTGSIGSSDKALNSVEASEVGGGQAGAVTLSGKNHYALNFNLNNASASFIVEDGGVLNGKVNSIGATTGTLTFQGSGSITGSIGSSSQPLLTVNTRGRVTLGGTDHYANTFNLDGTSAEFIIQEGGTLNGDIDSTVAGEGALTFQGNGTINGKIGKSNKLANINILNSNKNNPEVTLTPDNFAGGAVNVNIGDGAKLTLNLSDSFSLTANITLTGQEAKFSVNNNSGKDINFSTPKIASSADQKYGILTFNSNKKSLGANIQNIIADTIETTGSSVKFNGFKSVAVNNIKIGTDTEFNSVGKPLSANNITFTKDDIQLTTSAAVVGNIAFGAYDSTVRLIDAGSIDGNITANDNSLGTLILAGNANIKAEQVKLKKIDVQSSTSFNIKDFFVVSTVNIQDALTLNFSSKINKIDIGNITLGLSSTLLMNLQGSSTFDLKSPVTKGNVTLSNGSSTDSITISGAGSLGTEQDPIKALNITANGSFDISVPVFTQNFTTSGSGAISLGNISSVNDIILGSSSRLKLKDGGKITGSVSGGTLEFLGNGTLIGGLQNNKVIISKNKTADLYSNSLYSNRILINSNGDLRLPIKAGNNPLQGFASVASFSIIRISDNIEFTDAAASLSLVNQTSGSAGIILFNNIVPAQDNTGTLKISTNQQPFRVITGSLLEETLSQIPDAQKQAFLQFLIASAKNGLLNPPGSLNPGTIRLIDLLNEITPYFSSVSIGTSSNRLNSFTVDGNGLVTIEPKIYADRVILNNNNLLFGSPLSKDIADFESGLGGFTDLDVQGSSTVAGTITNKNDSGVTSTINLGANVLTLDSGTMTLASQGTGKVKIVTAFDSKNPQNIGRIVVNSGATLDVSAAKLEVVITGASLASSGKRYSLFDVQEGGILNQATTSVIVDNEDTATPKPNWLVSQAGVISTPLLLTKSPNPSTSDSSSTVISSVKDNKYLLQEIKDGTLFIIDDSDNGLKEDFGQTIPEIVTAFSDVDKNSEAAEFVTLLGRLAVTSPEKQQEAAKRLVSVLNPHKALDALTTNTIQSTQSVVTGRMDSFITIPSTSLENSAFGATSGNTNIGIASGDNNDLKNTIGAWFSPVAGKAIQRSDNKIAGYKGITKGGVLGLDFLINEDLVAGGSYSLLETNLRYRGFKDGDKTKINMNIFSLYSILQIKNNWFGQGIISFGNNKINNFEKRVASVNSYEIAQGKFNSRMFSTQFLTGYNYFFKPMKLLLTPSIGLMYSHFSDNSYDETGTSFQNLSVDRKKYKKLEGIFGVRFSKPINLNGAILTPETHIFVNRDLNNKLSTTKIFLEGTENNISSTSDKPERDTYNLGFSLNVKREMLVFGLGYDNFQGKLYSSHQGSLRLKVNF